MEKPSGKLEKNKNWNHAESTSTATRYERNKTKQARNDSNVPSSKPEHPCKRQGRCVKGITLTILEMQQRCVKRGEQCGRNREIHVELNQETIVQKSHKRRLELWQSKIKAMSQAQQNQSLSAKRPEEGKSGKTCVKSINLQRFQHPAQNDTLSTREEKMPWPQQIVNPPCYGAIETLTNRATHTWCKRANINFPRFFKDMATSTMPSEKSRGIVLTSHQTKRKGTNRRADPPHKDGTDNSCATE